MNKTWFTSRHKSWKASATWVKVEIPFNQFSKSLLRNLTTRLVKWCHNRKWLNPLLTSTTWSAAATSPKLQSKSFDRISPVLYLSPVLWQYFVGLRSLHWSPLEDSENTLGPLCHPCCYGRPSKVEVCQSGGDHEGSGRSPPTLQAINIANTNCQINSDTRRSVPSPKHC